MTNKAAANLQELETTLHRWQEIEDASIAQTTAIIQKSANPIIKLLMEIIRQDSAMHRRVQQAILDSVQKEAFQLAPEDLAEIWDMVEKHIEAEKETLVLAEKARANCQLFVQQQLLSYLLEDEQKHDRLLERLESFKRTVSPHA